MCKTNSINIYLSKRYMYVDEISDKHALFALIKGAPGPIVLKFGAEWCAPCKQIDSYVGNQFRKMPDNVTCGMLDVDDNFELYAFLKTKRVVPSIPTIVMYLPGVATHVPEAVVIGTSISEIDAFFTTVLQQAAR